MYECDWCGKRTDELWTVPGEYGKNESVCNDCVPKPPKYDISGEQHLRCPVCKSTKYQDVSERYWFSRAGGLFQCKRKHLFTVQKMTQEVHIPDDSCPKKAGHMDVTGEQSLRCPLCLSAEYRNVTKDYSLHHSEQLFECNDGHLFEVRTVTQEVWIPDD